MSNDKFDEARMDLIGRNGNDGEHYFNPHDISPGPLVFRPAGIEATLAERGKRYGEFYDHAVIAQAIQDAMRAAPSWEVMAADQKQALSVIADKIARILNGDPDYLDNWHDIIGYARLVEKRLQERQP